MIKWWSALPRREKLLLWLLYTLLVAGTITWFSAQDGDTSGEYSYGLAEMLHPEFAEDETLWYGRYLFNIFLRKLAHFCIFAALGAGIFGTLQYQDRLPRFWPAIGFGLAFSILDELHQSFVPGRVAKVSDVLIDTLGVAAGVLVLRFLFRACERRRKQGEAAAPSASRHTPAKKSQKGNRIRP